MESLGVDDLKAIVARIASIMSERRDELVRLDGAVGDGDLGLTMEKGFQSARSEAEASTETDPGKLLMRIGMRIARDAPSTMGTLVATGFLSGGKAGAGTAPLGLPEMAAFFDAFVTGIMQRGKAKPGEKTVVDVFYPVAQSLKQSAASGSSLSDAFRGCRAAAAEGLARSTEALAQHGRVAYYQEQSRGKVDPGSVAGTYIVQGFCDHIEGT